MTDKELIEKAAKAAGLKIDKSSRNGGGSWNTGFDIAGNSVLDWHNGRKWNPLTDDGDAQRLRNKLRMDVFYTDQGVNVANDDVLMAFEPWGGDDLKVERRAITRAAAQMQLNKEKA